MPTVAPTAEIFAIQISSVLERTQPLRLLSNSRGGKVLVPSFEGKVRCAPPGRDRQAKESAQRLETGWGQAEGKGKRVTQRGGGEGAGQEEGPGVQKVSKELHKGQSGKERVGRFVGLGKRFSHGTIPREEASSFLRFPDRSVFFVVSGWCGSLWIPSCLLCLSHITQCPALAAHEAQGHNLNMNTKQGKRASHCSIVEATRDGKSPNREPMRRAAFARSLTDSGPLDRGCTLTDVSIHRTATFQVWWKYGRPRLVQPSDEVVSSRDTAER